jgi:hypothetical protein
MFRYLYAILCLGVCMLLLIGCGKKSEIPGQNFKGPGIVPGEPPPAHWKSNAPVPPDTPTAAGTQTDATPSGK